MDRKLSFDEHITVLCRRTSQKLHVLSRVASHMSCNKKIILLKTFITSQFNYCPSVSIKIYMNMALGSYTKIKSRILKLSLKVTSLSQFTWETHIISSLKFTKLKITFLQKLWETFFTFKKMKTTASAVVPVLLPETWEKHCLGKRRYHT